MSGSFRIPGGHGAGNVGNVGGAGDGGSPSTGRTQQPGQPPEGLQVSRVASGRRPAPRGRIADWPPRGGPASPGRPATLMAPPQQRMEKSETLLAPPRPGTIPSVLDVQPHVVQQLVLSGDISGATQAGNAEADQRVKNLQDKLGDRPIDWHEAVDNLDDLHSDSRISENTYLQLANATKRAHDGGGAQAASPAHNTFEADALGLWTGFGHF